MRSCAQIVIVAASILGVAAACSDRQPKTVSAPAKTVQGPVTPVATDASSDTSATTTPATTSAADPTLAASTAIPASTQPTAASNPAGAMALMSGMQSIMGCMGAMGAPEEEGGGGGGFMQCGMSSMMQSLPMLMMGNQLNSTAGTGGGLSMGGLGGSAMPMLGGLMGGLQ